MTISNQSASLSLEVCVRKLPLSRASLLAERDQIVNQTLKAFQSAIAKQDEHEAFRGFRLLTSCIDLDFALTLAERANLINLVLEISLNQPPVESWVSLNASSRALRCAGILLAPRLPGLITKLNLNFTQLYQAYQRIHEFKFSEPCKLKPASNSVIRVHGEALFFLIRNAKFYLPNSSAQQVSDTLLDALQEDDASNLQILDHVVLLTAFYPGFGNDDVQPRLETFLKLWGRIDTSAEWDTCFMILVRRLAKHKLRQEPFPLHLNELFGRVHASLKANVFSDRKSALTTWSYLNIKKIQVVAGKLVVDLLHLEGAMDRLEYLLASVRTHMHPSNAGAQAERLVLFLGSLCDSFATRLGRDSNSLSKDVKKRFVLCLMPLLEAGLLGKSLIVINAAQACIRHLAWVAPMTVSNRLLPGLIESGLDPDNLTRSHQAPAAMKALTVMIQPLALSGPQSRQILTERLPQLLMQSLPGLDPNDQRKTAVTMMLSYVVLSCIPVDSASSDMEQNQVNTSNNKPLNCFHYGVDDDDNSMQIAECPVPDIAEWAHALIGRLLILALSRGKRAKKGMSAQFDSLMDFFFECTCRLAFMQSSKVLESGPVRQVCGFLLEECLPNAYIEAVILARALSMNSPNVLKQLVSPLCARVAHDGHKDRVTWSLACLGGLCRLAGPNVLEFLPELDETIKRGLRHSDVGVRKMCAKLIRRVARCLLDTYQVKPDQPIAVYGMEASWADAQPKWHVCSEVQERAAHAFLLGYWELAVNSLLKPSSSTTASTTTPTTSDSLSSPTLNDREFRFTNLQVCFQVVRGMLSHIQQQQPAVNSLVESTKYLTCWPARESLFVQVSQITAVLNSHTDTRGLKVCAKIIGLLGQGARGPRGSGNGEHVKGFRMWSSWLKELSNSRAREAEERAKARRNYALGLSDSGEVVDRADMVEMPHVILSHIGHCLQRRTYEASLVAARSAKDTPAAQFYEQAALALFHLGEHGFSEVRKTSQNELKFVYSRCSWIQQLHLPLLLSTLSKTSNQVTPEEWTGSIYMLSNEKLLLSVNRKSKRWISVVRAIVLQIPQAILALPPHRQAKSQDRLQRVIHRLLAEWSEFPKHSPKAEEDALERQAFLKELCLFAQDSSVHWRLKLTALTVVSLLINEQTQIPEELWLLAVNCMQSDVLPLATLSFHVLRRLFAASSASSSVTTAALFDTQEFWFAAAKVLTEDRTLSAGDDDNAEWSSSVDDLMKIARSLVPRPDFPRSRLPLFAAKDFLSSKADFWCSLAKATPNKQLVVDTFNFLAFHGDSARDRLMRRNACAELFAGVIRAKPENSLDLLPGVTRLLNEIPNGGLWGDAFRFVTRMGNNPVGNEILAKYVQDELQRSLSGVGIDGEPLSDNEGFMFVSNLLKVCSSVMIEYRPLASRLLPTVLKCFTHSYKAVREVAGFNVALCIHLQCADKSLVISHVLQAAQTSQDGLEACVQFLLPLSHHEAKSYMDVLVALIVPVLIRAQGHPDVELASLSKSALTHVANVVKAMSVPQLAQELEKVLAEEALVAKDWSKRRAVAAFLGPFHTTHSSLLYKTGAAGLVQRTAEALLRDPQAEVREQAKQLLSGLWAAALPVDILLSPARDRYLKLARSNGDVTKKRAGVLALCAMVLSFPYEVPLFLPVAVVELARVVAQNNEPTAKSALSEFRRTHQDDWTEHRLKFDPEQLGEIDGVLVSPDYYA